MDRKSAKSSSNCVSKRLQRTPNLLYWHGNRNFPLFKLPNSPESKPSWTVWPLQKGSVINDTVLMQALTVRHECPLERLKITAVATTSEQAVE
ncbi:hypothetical protein ACSBR1_032031 [Camellia fascicularis]